MLAALACDPLSESEGEETKHGSSSKDSVKQQERQQLKIQENPQVSLQVSPHSIP